MRILAIAARALRANQPLARVLRPIFNRALPRRPIAVTVMSGAGAGIKLVIDPQREKFYWTGSYEPAVQQVIERMLHPGAVFWDVGAHVGFYSLIGARLVGPTGFVHAFEPFEPNLLRLRASAALNRVQNVAVHDIAVSDEVGDVLLYEGELSVMATLVRKKSSGPAARVKCTTLDALAARLGVPFLIKIDVEGAEDRVLAGGGALLAQGKVNLVMEFLSDMALEQARHRLSGYQFERLDATNWLVVPQC